MKIIEKNEGQKIPHLITGNSITFGDEVLTLNLAQYERDDAVDIDITRDTLGNLLTGVIPGQADWFVAQIYIPARKFETTMEEAPAEMMMPSALEESADVEDNQISDETPAEESNRMVEKRTPLPFDMDSSDLTLTLWAIDSQVQEADND